MRVKAVYVPLDSSSPVERLALITDEARLDEVIHDSETADQVKGVASSRGAILSVTSLPRQVPEMGASVSKAEANVFIMFTSGSTGKPKDVQLTNANYVAHTVTTSRYLDLEKETVLQQISVGFDLSLAQIFYGFGNGGILVMASNRGYPTDLAALILREKVTFTFCVPSEYSVILRYGAESLRKCSSWRVALSSGETFLVNPRESFRDIHLPGSKVLNFYGPTEASVVASMREVDYRESSSVKVSIGRTVDSYAVQIVDEDMQPVPVGWPGHIVLGGPVVSPGYFHNEELTKQRFIADSIKPREKTAGLWRTIY